MVARRVVRKLSWFLYKPMKTTRVFGRQPRFVRIVQEPPLAPRPTHAPEQTAKAGVSGDLRRHALVAYRHRPIRWRNRGHRPRLPTAYIGIPHRFSPGGTPSLIGLRQHEALAGFGFARFDRPAPAPARC